MPLILTLGSDLSSSDSLETWPRIRRTTVKMTIIAIISTKMTTDIELKSTTSSVSDSKDDSAVPAREATIQDMH